jgi:hypothetical protein
MVHFIVKVLMTCIPGCRKTPKNPWQKNPNFPSSS